MSAVCTIQKACSEACAGYFLIWLKAGLSKLGLSNPQQVGFSFFVPAATVLILRQHVGLWEQQ